jgi:hypothetical protein
MLEPVIMSKGVVVTFTLLLTLFMTDWRVLAYKLPEVLKSYLVEGVRLLFNKKVVLFIKRLL